MRVRSVYTAPQFNVQTISQQFAQARQTEQAAFSFGATAVSAVMRIQNKYQQRKNELELQQFKHQAALGESAFIRQYGTKRVFTADDVSNILSPEEIERKGINIFEPYVSEEGVAGERPRQDIPAYEVYPDMYDTFMKKNLPIWGKTITDDRVRVLTLATQNKMLESKSLKQYLDAVAAQERVMRSEVTVNVQQLTDKGHYDLARDSVSSSSVLEPGEKSKLLNNIDVREETDAYDNIMSQEDLGALEVISSKLSKDFEEYKDEDGKLSKPAKRTYKLRVDATIDRIVREKQAVNKARVSVVRTQIRDAISDIKQGHFPDINFLKDRRAILYASNTPMDQYLLQQLEEASQFGTTYKQINMVDYHTGDSVIDQVLAGNAGLVTNTSKFEADLREANEKKQRALQHDAVGHTRKHYKIPSFNVNGIYEVDNPDNTLVQAKQTAAFIENTYNITDAYLSKAEWGVLKNAYEDMGLNQKLSTLQTISSVMGSETERFYESGYKHEAGPMVVVGSIANDHPEGARMVLQGQEYIKDKTVALPKDLDIEAREVLTTMFGDPEVASQRLSAVKAAYAYLTYSEHGVATPDVTDRDLLKRAVLNTTKGKIEYGGTVFEAPDSQVNEQAFERKIKSISAKHWDLEGGFVDYPSKRVKEDLDDGKLSFVRTGSGKYAIVNEEGAPLVSARTNDVYIFDYNKDVYNVDQEKAFKNYEAYLESLTDPDILADKRQKRLDNFMRIGGSL